MKVFLLPVLLLSVMSCVHAQIPQAISYQGMILDPATGQRVADGPHEVKFSFYDSAASGTLHWESALIPVETFQGLFATIIPVPADANWSKPFYVETMIDGASQSTRIQLTTVAYAFHANSTEVALSMNASGLSGIIADARFSTHLQDLADGSLSGEKVGPGINADNITTGTLNGNLVGPGIEASHITGNTNGLLPNEVLDEDLQDLADGQLSASKIDSGIDASKITTGTLPNSVLSTHLQDLADGSLPGSKVGPGINASMFTTGMVPYEALDRDLQDLSDGELSADLVGSGINAGNITTGVLQDKLFSDNLKDLIDGTLEGSKVGPGINAANVSTGKLPLSVIPVQNLVNGIGENNTLAYWTADNQVGATQLYWQTSEDELGINTPSPAADIDITHDSSHPSGVALIIDNQWSVATGVKSGVKIDFSVNPSLPVDGVNAVIDDTGTGERVGIEIEYPTSAQSTATFYGAYGQIGLNGAPTGINTGVVGIAENSGLGVVTGVYGYGANGTSTSKYGVSGLAGSSSNPGVTKYGVLGEATGDSGIDHYGVYGVASQGTTRSYGIAGIAAVAVNNYALYADGDVYATGIINCTGNSFGSDQKLKKNISLIPSQVALEKLLALKPAAYHFKRKKFPTMNLSAGRHLGLIAQETESVLPDIVTEVINPSRQNSKGHRFSEVQYKSVNYVSLIPVLIRAMQHQQTILDQQRKIVELLSEEKQLIKADLMK